MIERDDRIASAYDQTSIDVSSLVSPEVLSDTAEM